LPRLFPLFEHINPVSLNPWEIEGKQELCQALDGQLRRFKKNKGGCQQSKRIKDDRKEEDYDNAMVQVL